MSDDRDLLGRWTSGDVEAGRELADRHFALLYRFFSTKMDEAPDDLVQQTLLIAVKKANTFDPSRGSVRSFLLGIAHYELLAHRRGRAREVQAMARAAQVAPSLQSSPSGPARRGQELALLLRALRRIPLEQQVLIELYYWEDLSTAEVASVLVIPAGTVKSRLSRARRELRSQLAELELTGPQIDSTLGDFQRWASAARAKRGSQDATTGLSDRPNEKKPTSM